MIPKDISDASNNRSGGSLGVSLVSFANGALLAVEVINFHFAKSFVKHNQQFDKRMLLLFIPFRS